MKPESSYKVVVRMQDRRDGGLRIWSEDLPGLVLSGARADVLADLKPALETIVSDMLGYTVTVNRLEPLAGSRPAVETPSRLARLRSAFARSPKLVEYSAAPCDA